MEFPAVCDRIDVRDGWAICPRCGKGKLLKLLPETSVTRLPCKCKLCRQEVIVNIKAPVPASAETSA